MDDFGTIDLRLFGVSAATPVYDGLSADERRGKRDLFEGAMVMLDLKAETPADPLDEMQAMLGEMTKELRERFQRFQSQRAASEADADAACDEAARKAAQADAKAAIEAVSLIVRTLEKIDSLQRTLSADRRDAAARATDDADLDVLADEFERMVEDRATERARAKFQAWKDEFARAGAAGGEAGGEARAGLPENGP